MTRTERLDAMTLTAWLREAADSIGMDDDTYVSLLLRISKQASNDGYVEARVIRTNYARATMR